MEFFQKVKKKIDDGFLQEFAGELRWLWQYIRRYRMTVVIHILLGVLGILMGRTRYLYKEGDNPIRWVRTMVGAVMELLLILPIQKTLPGLVENRCVSHSLQVMLTMY